MLPTTRTWLLGCLLLSGCSLEGGLDSINRFDPIVHPPPPSAAVAGSVVDARTGRPVETPVQITFGGEAQEFAQDLFGHRIERIEAGSGWMSFGLAGNLHPQPGRPIDVRILAQAHGFEANAVRLAVRSGGVHEFLLVLDRKDNPLAPGVDGQAQAFMGPGSRLAAPLTVEAALFGIPLATWSLPAGATIFSEGGEVAEARGSVRHEAPSPQLFATFPGGTDSGIEVDGVLTSGTLTVGAVVTIGLQDAEGRPLDVRDDSAQVQVRIDPDLLNPGTNDKIRIGDAIGVHQWIPEAGWWRETGLAPLDAGPAGPVARFRARSGRYALGFRTVSCADGRLRLRGNSRGGAIQAFRGTADNAEGVRTWRFAPGQEEVVLTEPPDLWRGQVVVRHGVELIRLPYDGLCGRTFEVEFPGDTESPENRSDWLLSPSSCEALRVTDLPILGVALLNDAIGPRSALDAQIQPSLLAPGLETRRDDLGRALGFTLRAGGPSVSRIQIILGGKTWSYGAPDPAGQAQVDITGFARDTGLCVEYR